MREILEKVKNGVLNVLFPATCVGCGREGKYLCVRCEGFVGEAALVCPSCQQSSFRGERHHLCEAPYGLEGLAGIWEYEGLIRNLLYCVKYTGVTHATEEMARRAFETMRKDEKRFEAFLLFLCSQDTRITYVPMYQKKERHKGFNHAKVFAHEIAKITGKKVLPTLEKRKYTKPQIDLTKKERLYNVKDSFAPYDNLDLRSVEKIVLVDDVWTTGSTLLECCRVLKRAGAREVWGFSIARTP